MLDTSYRMDITGFLFILMFLCFMPYVPVYAHNNSEAPLPVPTNLTAANDFRGIRLRWDQPIKELQEVTSYIIKVISNGQISYIYTRQNLTNYYFRDVIIGKIHTFYVKAKYKIGQASHWSNPTSIIFKDSHTKRTTINPPTVVQRKTTANQNPNNKKTQKVVIATSTSVTSTDSGTILSQSFYIKVFATSATVLLISFCALLILVLREKNRYLKEIRRQSYDNLQRDGSTNANSEHAYDLPTPPDYLELI